MASGLLPAPGGRDIKVCRVRIGRRLVEGPGQHSTGLWPIGRGNVGRRSREDGDTSRLFLGCKGLRMPGVVPVGQDSEVQCGDDLVRVGLGRMDDFAFSCLFRKEISSSMIDVVLH